MSRRAVSCGCWVDVAGLGLVLDFRRERKDGNASETCRTGGGVSLCGGDADWEFGGYFAAGVADFEGVRRDCVRGHAADGETADAF